MDSYKDQVLLSPLFVDTEFIPSSLRYFTIYNRQISNMPSVLPYTSDDTTFAQIQDILFQTKTKSAVKKSGIFEGDKSIREMKVKQCKKKIDGEQIQIASNSKPIDLQALLSRKSQRERKERCNICCIMLINKEDVIHLSFEWKSELSTVRTIVEEINSKYKVKLSEDDIQLRALTISTRVEKSGLTSLKYESNRMDDFSHEVFSYDRIAYLGVDIVSDKQPASRFITKQPQGICQTQIEIVLPDRRSFKFICYKIKQYQINELLGILGVEDAESRGLKILNRVYEPTATFQTITQQLQNALANFIVAEVTGQAEVFRQEVRRALTITENELKKLSQQNQGKKIKTKLTALMLFNSSCEVYSNRQSKFKLLYHIIHKYIRNYFTHFNTLFDTSISVRIVKSLYQEIQQLPVFKGPVFRKIGYELRCKVGEIIEFHNFIIATSDYHHIAVSPPKAYKTKETLVKIYSKSAKKCHTLSPFAYLEEVVFLPFTKFQVISCDEDEKAVYLNLEEIPKTEEPSKFTIILWVDDKAQEGKNIFVQYLKWFKSSVCLLQFKNNKQLSAWVCQYAISTEGVNASQIVTITNMKRSQYGQVNPTAGIDTIQIMRGLIPQGKIIVYIGNVQYTVDNLISNKIDPKSVDVINSPLALVKKLKNYCQEDQLEPNLNEKSKIKAIQSNPKDILKKIETQNWHVYFPNAKQPQAIKPVAVSSILHGSNDHQDWDEQIVKDKKSSKLEYIT